MATFNRPNLIPTWCRDNQANVAQPPDSLRATGYTANEIIMAEHLNWVYWQLGNWIGYLDQANASTVMSTTLDVNTRLVGGGNWAFSALTGILSWDDTAYLSIPSIPLQDNAIAAGSVALGPNQLAHVTCNAPFTTSGGLTSGDADVTGLATTMPLAVGQSVSGAGVPSNTTITAINDSTVTLSKAATATNPTATLTFAGSGPLTVQSADAASFLPNANTVVIALGREMLAIVGANSGQMAVRDNESKRLLGTGYVSTLRAPAGESLIRNQAVYISTGANGRTSGSFYTCDAGATFGATRGQFVGFAIANYSAGSTAHIVSAGIVNGFSGLTAGSIYYLDPANPGAITVTQPTTASLYSVPVGCAITSTSMRINPSATHALTAIQDGLTVKGPLIVKPHNSGNAFVVTAQDGATVVSSVTDAGLATLKSLAVTGATNAADITSSTKITSPSFIATTGFKTHVPAGRYATTNYSGGQISTNTLHFDGNQLSTRSFIFNPLYAGSIVGINFTQTAPNTPTLTILGVETTEGSVGGSYTAFSGSPLGFATYRGGIQLAKGAAPLRQGWYYFMNLTWAQTGFSNYVTVDLTVEYTT